MRVRLFTTEDCKFCPWVKTYLINKGIKFEVIDCTLDPNQIKPASDISGVINVPQVKIGHEVIVGINWGKLADALRKNGLMD